ncbi:TPA: hypothetical protein L4F61_004558 [Pseudomonas aeruginosa]|uniref:hypothetical protein n=1 Tax=Alphaproteobacteria TaxID=28211 RepID=UPI000A8B885E|nr:MULTISPECIES: hypothetical protein [Alphaproteobacteria]USQ70280.1 hypothetical protein NF552_11955 [Roseomonas mucosa]HBO1272369.1 hypothetical protein [Pseudomonas aeruginosa]HBO1574642.1 hypothetical protein [Pseudomonas aeruginosa]
MVAIVVFLFLSGRTNATSMVVVRPGTIGPAPVRAGTKWKAAGDGFFARDAKPKAAEKSWRRTLREDERGEAGLRSDRANRGRKWSARFRKSREYGNGDRPAPRRGSGTLRRSHRLLSFLP